MEYLNNNLLYKRPFIKVNFINFEEPKPMLIIPQTYVKSQYILFVKTGIEDKVGLLSEALI